MAHQGDNQQNPDYGQVPWTNGLISLTNKSEGKWKEMERET